MEFSHKRKNKPGAGRPKTDNLRTLRGLKFNDQEWETIQGLAAQAGMSARAFLTHLVEKEQAETILSSVRLDHADNETTPTTGEAK